MSHAAKHLSKSALQVFAEKEFAGAPLTRHVHVRVPQRLDVFLKTIALTEGVSESSVFRYACEQWAASQGYETAVSN